MTATTETHGSYYKHTLDQLSALRVEEASIPLSVEEQRIVAALHVLREIASEFPGLTFFEIADQLPNPMKSNFEKLDAAVRQFWLLRTYNCA